MFFLLGGRVVPGIWPASSWTSEARLFCELALGRDLGVIEAKKNIFIEVPMGGSEAETDARPLATPARRHECRVLFSTAQTRRPARKVTKTIRCFASARRPGWDLRKWRSLSATGGNITGTIDDFCFEPSSPLKELEILREKPCARGADYWAFLWNPNDTISPNRRKAC